MVMSSIFRAENLEVSGKVFIFVDRNKHARYDSNTIMNGIVP
jgi:hypothetical protein